MLPQDPTTVQDPGMSPLTWSAPVLLPKVDVLDIGKEIVYLFELPGVDPERVEVDISDQELSVRGQVEDRQATGGYLYRERPTGGFQRSLQVLQPVDITAAVASFRHGILEVHFPKGTTHPTTPTKRTTGSKAKNQSPAN